MSMAIDVCSEISSAGISPRISFSHYLSQGDVISPNQARLDSSLLESDSAFDFCVGNFFFAQELSSADVLFSDGRILPASVKMRSVNGLCRSTKRPERTTTISEKKRLKEFLSADDSDELSPSESKSFWKFRRTSSLNSETSRNKSLIRSLQFLSRCNSTGSAPNPKPLTVPKETQNQTPNLQRQHSIPSIKSSSPYCYTYNSSRRPSMAKSFGSHVNGVRISPVLNLPPPYIAKMTKNFFGCGSLFCNGKFKKKKK